MGKFIKPLGTFAKTPNIRIFSLPTVTQTMQNSQQCKNLKISKIAKNAKGSTFCNFANFVVFALLGLLHCLCHYWERKDTNIGSFAFRTKTPILDIFSTKMH